MRQLFVMFVVMACVTSSHQSNAPDDPGAASSSALRPQHLALLVVAASGAGLAQARQTPRPVEPGFETFEGAPPSEQLPAQPLVMTAYGFIWVVLLLYGLSLWRRLGRVEREVAELAQKIERRTQNVR